MKRWLVILSVIVLGGLTTASVSHSQYTQVKVTHNTFDDSDPQMSASGCMVWRGTEMPGAEIFFCDGVSTIRLTNDDYNDVTPMVSETCHVAWNGYDGHDWEIFLYDGTTVSKLTDDYAIDDRHLQMSDNGRLVWQKGREIYFYDGTTVAKVSGNYSAEWPDISPNGIYATWSERLAGSNEEIVLFDGTATNRITDTLYADISPKVNSSGQVAWLGYDDVDQEIFFYNGASVVKLTDDADWQLVQQINDSGFVVWSAYNATTNSEIYLYDGSHTIQLTANAYEDFYPQINSSGQVVWTEYDGADYEIFVFDGSATVQVTDNVYDDASPQIDNNGNVIWSGYDGTDYEIFVAYRCIDTDGDGYGDPASSYCEHAGHDCNDYNAAINPGAMEVCDGIDNNCNAGADEEPAASLSCSDTISCTEDFCNHYDHTCEHYPESSLCDDSDACTSETCQPGIGCAYVIDKDTDADGYVDASCSGGTDCDDSNPAVNPAGAEGPYGGATCADGLDNDCDGLLDGLDTGCFQCSVPADCDDENPCTSDSCVSGFCSHANNEELCDDGNGCTMNDACSGGICSGAPLDEDNDHYVSNICGGEDCNDSDPAVHPDAPEGPHGDPTCGDSLDNDCDGGVDSADTGCLSSCTDQDGDGYGSPASSECPFPEEDCDDTDPYVNPGMTEVPGNGTDDDCDSATPDQPPWSAATPAEASGYSLRAMEHSKILNNLGVFCIPVAGVVFSKRLIRRSRPETKTSSRPARRHGNIPM